MRTGTKSHLNGVSALALLLAVVAAPAAAQDASATTEQAAVDDGDIVVTATKRSESVTKVPISITAFSQESLDQRGIRDIRDVVDQTPGIDIARGSTGSGGQTRVSIRGIDSTAGAATSAVYIDDTPIMARNSSLNYNGTTIPFLFDLERVEVLRGPQGTLFGASSQGGAVRFITPTPSLTQSSVYSRAAVNSTKDGGIGYEAGVAVGLPIIEGTLGLRLSAYHRRDGGWIDRQSWQDANDREENANFSDTTVLRAAMLWEPAAGLTIAPSIYYQDLKFNDRGDLWTRCPATTGSPISPDTVPCPNGVSDPGAGKHLNYSPIRQPSRDRFYLPSLKIGYDAGAISINSVTSYFDRHVEDINDATNVNDRVTFGNAYLFPITPGFDKSITWQNPNIYQKVFTQEVRLSGGDTDSPIKWTVGGYYSRGSVKSDLPIYQPHFNDLYFVRYGRTPQAAGVPPLVNGNARYYGNEETIEESIAAFANVDVKVVDRLTLNLGARYSRDTLDFDVVERGVSYVGGISTAAGRLRENPFLPKVGLSFQATRNALYYASFARGYRTGGVNKTLPDVCRTEADALGIDNANTYQSDRTDSYEIGTKNRLLGGSLQYEISAYYTKWNNIQQQLRLQCAFSLVANTAAATSKGFDASITMRPDSNLTIGAAVGYTDATYDETIQIGTAPIVVGGQQLGATPWTINLNAEYHLPTNSDLDPFIRFQYNYRSVNRGTFLWQVPTSTTYDPTRVLPTEAQSLDARAGVTLGPVSLQIYGENILNNVGYIANTPIYARGPLWRGSTLRPRTIGLQLIGRY
ncbi:TonB-dependent receptor [uncultured Sphingomonas sp.]|uniref:TonB-dependent receptor n=1 Tax=uncultured Sphingomonas sp. TaxID=158754 RepID=UPI0025E49BDB|nr:TonB-dependent receptor [uncultured Sphingomonas sp.]